MEQRMAIVNQLMVEVFNDILKLEERALRSGVFTDVSITEMHTVEAIGMHQKPQMSDVARRLNITLGTLTISIRNLVNKGYVERFKCLEDKRIVQVGLTKKGRLLYRMHHQFHIDMMKSSLKGLTEEEASVLVSALENLHRHLSGNVLLGR